MLDRVFGHQVNSLVFARWVGWNLFLAVIPAVLGYALLAVIRSRSTPQDRVGRAIVAVILFIVWLLFLPNTCYLLTEWRHFLASIQITQGSHPNLRIGAQALFFFFYSGAGMLCFVLAIRPFEAVCKELNVPFPAVAPFLFLLVSAGVYLGLVLRLNSWDMLTRPPRVLDAFKRIWYDRPLTIAVGGFALLLWGLYEALDIWVDGMLLRLGRLRPSSAVSLRASSHPKRAPAPPARGLSAPARQSSGGGAPTPKSKRVPKGE